MEEVNLYKHLLVTYGLIPYIKSQIEFYEKGESLLTTIESIESAIAAYKRDTLEMNKEVGKDGGK